MKNQEHLDISGRLTMRDAHFERMRNIHGKNKVLHGPDDIMEGVAKAVTGALTAIQEENKLRRSKMRQKLIDSRTIH